MKTVAVTTMVLATAVALALSGGKASANPGRAPQTPGWDEAPQTAEEHFASASYFRERADAYRAEAETHRDTIARREKARAHPIHKPRPAARLPG